MIFDFIKNVPSKMNDYIFNPLLNASRTITKPINDIITNVPSVLNSGISKVHEIVSGVINKENLLDAVKTTNGIFDSASKSIAGAISNVVGAPIKGISEGAFGTSWATAPVVLGVAAVIGLIALKI